MNPYRIKLVRFDSGERFPPALLSARWYARAQRHSLGTDRVTYGKFVNEHTLSGASVAYGAVHRS